MPPPSYLARVRALAFGLSALAIVATSAPVPVLALPRPSPRPHESNVTRTIATVDGSTIALYELNGSRATGAGTFAIDGSSIAGVAIDRGGRVVGAVVQTQTPGPCTDRGPIPTSCLAIYDRSGALLAAVAPPGYDADATYTGLATDAFGDVYVSDRAYNAIFSYPAPRAESQAKPTFVAQADPFTLIPSSVAVAPHGTRVAALTVPTNCDGSLQVILYERRRDGYAAHDLTCRSGHGTFAGRTGPIAVSDDGAVLVPASGHVDVYARGRAPFSFALPNHDALASGLSFAGDELYVADSAADVIDVYSAPKGGWTAGPPTLDGVLHGFSTLGPIAVR